jgi:hypothetical protein
MNDTTNRPLSVAPSPNGDIVYIHANKAGLDTLSRAIERLKARLEKDECGHDHLYTEEWGGHELTTSMLDAEKKEDCKQVHHVEICSWNEEWKGRHGL